MPSPCSALVTMIKFAFSIVVAPLPWIFCSNGRLMVRYSSAIWLRGACGVITPMASSCSKGICISFVVSADSTGASVVGVGERAASAGAGAAGDGKGLGEGGAKDGGSQGSTPTSLSSTARFSSTVSQIFSIALLCSPTATSIFSTAVLFSPITTLSSTRRETAALSGGGLDALAFSSLLTAFSIILIFSGPTDRPPSVPLP